MRTARRSSYRRTTHDARSSLPAVPARTASPLARSSVVDERSDCRRLLRPPEIGAVNPNPMQDDGQFTGDRDLGLRRADLLHQPDAPRFQRRPTIHSGQQHTGGLVEASPGKSVTAFGNSTRLVDLARLVALGGQAETGTPITGMRKTLWVI